MYKYGTLSIYQQSTAILILETGLQQSFFNPQFCLSSTPNSACHPPLILLVIHSGSGSDRCNRHGPEPEHPADHLQHDDKDSADRERREGDGRYLRVAGITDRRQSWKVKSNCQ